MKKIIYLIAIAMMLCSLSACQGGVLDQGTENGGAKDNITENEGGAGANEDVTEIKESHFLITRGEVFLSEDKAFDKFVYAAEYGIETAVINRNLDGVKQQREHPFDSTKTLEYDYSTCKKLKYASDEIGTFYSVYDVYKLGKDVKFTFLHGTDILCDYIDTSYRQPEDAKDLSDQAVLNIAEQFLNVFLPENTLSKFERKESIGVDALSHYWVSYKRYIHGYKTDESISVIINRAGKVNGLNAHNINKYDSLASKISKDALDKAAKELTEKINAENLTDLVCHDPYITTNTEGDVYLALAVFYKTSNGYTIGDTVYINVN